MKTLLAVVFVAAAAVVLAVTLSGPLPTGPGRPAKAPEGPDALSGFMAGDSEWRSWSEEDAVRLLVDAPVKWIGLERFPPESRLELKDLMERTEERVRSIVGRSSRSGVDEREVREELEVVLREYSARLEEMSTTR